MDLVKIGHYIAVKRKELGMTQKQLAEKLGMSDKSVSKWERGVCLPDVSIYSDLCFILAININEFLAGEDIAQKNIGKKSEENIIGVTTDSKHKQNKLKLVISVLLLVILFALSIIGITVYKEKRPQNYVAPVPENSVEMQTIRLLSGTEGAYAYDFVTTDKYESLRLYIKEYHNGKLMNRDDEYWEIEFDGFDSPKEGEILIIPDFKEYLIKVIVSTGGTKLSTEIPILTDVEGRENYLRSATHIEGETKILYGIEEPLVGLIYGKDKIRVQSICDFLSEEADLHQENDYVYFFAYEFRKE